MPPFLPALPAEVAQVGRFRQAEGMRGGSEIEQQPAIGGTVAVLADFFAAGGGFLLGQFAQCAQLGMVGEGAEHGR